MGDGIHFGVTYGKNNFNNEFLSKIIDSLPYPFYIINAHNYVTVFANKATSLAGNWVGKKCHSLIHQRENPCTGDEYPCPLEEVKRTKGPVIIKLAHLDESENETIHEIHGYPIFDNEGNVIQMLEYSIDITGKEAQHAKEKSDESYRAIFETAPNLITTFNQEGFILDCNGRIMEVLGYEREEIIGEPMAKIIHPDYLEKAQKSLAEILSKGHSYNKEYKMVKKDGGIIDVSINSSGLKRLNGEYNKTICIIDDITQHKEVEEALEQSEESFGLAMKGANDGLWDWDVVTGEVYFSPRWKRMLGHEEHEICNSFGEWKDRLHPDDLELSLGYINDFLEGRIDNFSTEFRMRHKDGHYINLLSRAFGVKDENGKYIRIVGTQLDITKRKKAMAQVARKNKVLDSINKVFRIALMVDTEEELGKTCLKEAENLTDSKFGLIGELNKDGLFDTIAISNPGWNACEIPEGQAGLVIKDMPIRGIDRATMIEGKSRIVNGEEAFSNHPDRIGVPKGHPKLTAFLGVPLKYDGKTIGIVGLGNKDGGYSQEDQENIEALSVAIVEALRKKRAEEDLKKNEEKYRSVIENVPGMIYRGMPDWTVSIIGGWVQEITGYSKEDFLGGNVTWLDLIHPKDRARMLEENAPILENPCSAEHEYRIKTKGGRIVWVKDIKTSTFIEGKFARVDGVITDITKRKNAEEKLKYAYSELKNVDQLKTDIISNVSHELRTPLSIIKASFELLEDEEDALEKSEIISLASKAVVRQNEIIENLLAASRIHQSNYIKTLKDVDLNEIINSSIDYLNEKRLKNNIIIHFIPNHEIPQIKGGINELELAINNIMDNSIKFNRDGGEIFVEITHNIIDKKVELVIKDTGIGIEKEYLDKIFMPLTQLDPSVSRQFEGTGMGLSVAKKIIDFHGGEIIVKSEIGKGSSFFINLPVE